MIVRGPRCCGVGLSKWSVTCPYCREAVITPFQVVMILIAAAFLFSVLLKLLGFL
jgi:prepilin signal peptidase PulO-like enzyme (type II secretory pathway)